MGVTPPPPPPGNKPFSVVLICCLLSTSCNWSAKMTSRRKVLNYSFTVNVHFRAVFSQLGIHLRVSRYFGFTRLSVRIYDHAMPKPRWRKGNRFGKLSYFQRPDLIPVCRQGHISYFNVVTDLTFFCELFQLVKIMLAISLRTETANYVQTPKSNATTVF